MLARVPASSANLGPGFDTLAVALTRYVEVRVEEAKQFSITSSGCGAGLFDNREHLGARIAAEALGHWNFSIHVDSQIPLSRGLGSSAALAVAAAAAAGHGDPLAVASEIDGHGENAAASMLGGLVVAQFTSEGVVARPLRLDPDWRFVVVVPEQELATADARRVLPARVDLHDAVANLNALGLLIAGLDDHRAWHPSAMHDHLHQPYRMGLLPFGAPLLEHLVRAGAAGSCWSGAGSTMLALVETTRAETVAQAAREFLAATSLAGEVWNLEADRTGLVLS